MISVLGVDSNYSQTAQIEAAPKGFDGGSEGAKCRICAKCGKCSKCGRFGRAFYVGGVVSLGQGLPAASVIGGGGGIRVP
ncbi:MAG: hypothetical protein ABI970_13815 [Chloroflexota bacterium]